jgi:SAM-dependent methyltransferase
VTRTERWAAQGDAWCTWADAQREEDVLPAFHDLLPPPSLRALDVGCGEGRLTRALSARGYDVCGVDIAAQLIEVAQARDPGGDYRVADAERLPFDEGAFDLVVAFNVLMSVERPAHAVAEAARVLVHGGRLCASIVHPLASAGTWEDDVLLVRGYLAERAYEDRTGGVVFANLHAPLERWSRWLEDAGLVVERLRELPRAGARGWDRLPMFLFLRAVKQ